MTISATQKKHLNNMNRAAQDVQLGTILTSIPNNLTTGSYTLVSADLLGSSTVAFTAFTGVKGFIVEGFRSGCIVVSTLKVAISGSSVLVSTGSSVSGSALVAGDVLNCIAF